jgi:hypothetical protein
MLDDKGNAAECFKHNDILKYYCLGCDEAACSDGIAIHGLVYYAHLCMI